MHSSSGTLQYLDWDSRMFGSTVYQWSPGGLSDTEVDYFLKNQLPKADLFYFFFEHITPGIRDSLKSVGAIPVDERVTWRKNITKDSAVIAPSPQFHLIPKTTVLPASLLRLAYLSGSHSRFRTDPHFSESHFKLLYREWIAGSLNGAIADEVWAHNEKFPSDSKDPQYDGMITVRTLNEKEAQIGLIAVLPEHHGKGIGTQLVQLAENFCHQRHLSTLKVVTQGANAAACALYQKCGFTISQKLEVFHLWSDSVQPGVLTQ